MRALDFAAVWDEAIPYDKFVESVEKNDSLWKGVYRTVRIPIGPTN